MKRFHLIEIEDQRWCPRGVRNAVTDYLQFGLVTMKPYTAIVPLLVKALQRSRTSVIVDLCSGGAGPWFWLQPALAEFGVQVSVLLTDIYPNLDAFARAEAKSGGRVQFHRTPVDACRVPGDLRGFRTVFTAFHHLRPEQARAVLSDAVRQRQGIAVFELTERNGRSMLMTLAAPLMLLLVTPWIRPFRWSRLVWTYLLPAVPLVTLFDGLVSCLRTYTVPELREMTTGLGDADYDWEIGVTRGKGLVSITYLIGGPKTLKR